MPMKAPRICQCGKRVAANTICACQAKRIQERKARYDANRPSARNRGYTREWEKERAVYLKANPQCRHANCNQPATVVDHIMAHKGNQTLFWNRANWQPLCTKHHNGWKQSLEKQTP
jgi:5-methylcytosine-specific restriction enzyme A